MKKIILILVLLCLFPLNTKAYTTIDIEGFNWRNPIPKPIIVIPKPPVVITKPVVKPVVAPIYKSYKSVVSVDRMYDLVKQLSNTDNARVAGTLNEKQAGDTLEFKLESYGYQVERQIINTYLKNEDGSKGINVQSSNVIGTLSSFNPNRKSIILMGHYDGVYTPAANDNASGVAMIVELARYLETRSDLKYNIIILLTGAEEGRHAGSQTFVAHPIVALSSIALTINFDMVGAGNYYELFNYTSTMKNGYYSKYALKIGKAMGLNITQKLTSWSDHKEFEAKGIPTITFMNLAAYPYYHKDSDTINKINKTTLRNISNIALNVIEEVNRK